MASVFWVQEKFAISIASQLENLPVSASTSELGPFYDKPVMILSASDSPQRRREEHRAISTRLPLGHHVIANKSNHWIMQEEPALVLEAIRGIADCSRRSQAIPVLEVSVSRHVAERVDRRHSGH
jgi:hypothetical protein